MWRMRRPSLKAKVTLAVLATTCLALVLSACALLAYELRAYRLSSIADLRSQADIIAAACAPALAFNDRTVATENLRMLRVRPTLRAAEIWRNDGTLFATFMPPDEASVAPQHSGVMDGYLIRGDTVELYHPIRHGVTRLGTLYLRARYEIGARLHDYLLILTAAMAASLAVAALVTTRLQRAVTEPISLVARAARGVMAQHDFSVRVPKMSNDEVGELVDAFNGMLQEVGARTIAMEQANAHLSVEMAERKRAEGALKLAARKKDEFIATLAHELRNPLAPISNATEILRRNAANGRDPAVTQRALDIMGRQLRQMVRLIDDLLDVSRITTGRVSIRKEWVDLVRVLHNAIEIAAPFIDAREHRLTVDLPTHPIYMEADATRLAQVFANLLNNAAKYTQVGGSIELRLTRSRGGIMVTVSDNGIGIGRDMQAAIFEMFVQADQSLEHGRTGLGIGLTLARQLLALHGASITVSSSGPGRGSQFQVWLPVPELAQTPATPTESPAEPSPALLSRQVLVADDNIDFAISLASLLESLGQEVTVTHDGVATIEAAQRLRPEVIFLDIGMPGLNGYEVARTLRGDPLTCHALMVAVTGWGQETDRQRAKANGIAHHLVKPVQVAQLVALLATLGRRHSAEAPDH